MLRSPWLPLIAVLVVIALIQGFVAKVYQIPSGSMEPTLMPGDRVVANRLAFSGSAPTSGDVIVFARPDSWKPAGEEGPSPLRVAVGWVGDVIGFGPSNIHAIVKRVVAGPGQTVECCDSGGHVMVDGKAQQGPDAAYDYPFAAGAVDCQSIPVSARCFAAYRVPPGQYFVLGDNRIRSLDSLAECRARPAEPIENCVRLVPRAEILASVVSVLFPPDRWGASMEIAR